MASPGTWQRLQSMWRIMRGLDPEPVPDYYVHPGDPPPRRPGPPRQGALVPLGPPKKPRPSSAVALPLPDSDIRDVEALGRDLDATGEP